MSFPYSVEKKLSTKWNPNSIQISFVDYCNHAPTRFRFRVLYLFFLLFIIIVFFVFFLLFVIVIVIVQIRFVPEDAKEDVEGQAEEMSGNPKAPAEVVSFISREVKP